MADGEKKIHFGSLAAQAADIRNRSEAAAGVPEDAEMQDVSAAALAVEEQKREAMKVIEQKRKMREIEGSLPVLDPDVRARLRHFGEPVTLFGEGPYERRLRLRKYLAELALGGAQLETLAPLKPAEAEPEKQTKKFYTEGSEGLRDARMEIAAHSLVLAKHRVQRQRVEQARTVAMTPEERAAGRRATADKLTGYVAVASQVTGRRPLSKIKVAPSGDHVLVGSWEQNLQLFSLPDCEKATEHTQFYAGHGNRVTGCAWHPQGLVGQSPSALNFASCGADKCVKLWSVASEDPLQTLGGHTDRIHDIAFHPSGNYVGTASQDKTFRLFDVTAGREAFSILEQEGHVGPVRALDFQCDGALVATADSTGVGRVWDLRHGRSISLLQGHMKQVLTVAFAPNGWLVATGGDDNVVKLWDLRRRDVLATITAHSRLVSGVAFEPTNGSYLCSSSYDSTLSLWDTANFKLIKTLRGHDNYVMGVDISPTDSGIVSCSYDKTWKLWQHRAATEHVALEDALNYAPPPADTNDDVPMDDVSTPKRSAGGDADSLEELLDSD
eukprot:TRINITY_DN14357_c0_g1_i1.p1 TRINITY_DN14357_c0_g1~~TRINITY_DN14357_c0_g1_i1.p1  ORF type:complete len:555 (+),score=185.20 TRINITY_DN14357_c0_g1_i1:66-1730(+)